METIDAVIKELKTVIADNEVLKSKLSRYIKYKDRYNLMKKDYLAACGEYENFAKNLEEILTEQEALKYILFAIIIQTGGKLEISKDTFEIANNRYKAEEISYTTSNGSVTYNIKRRENEPQVQSNNS